MTTFTRRQWVTLIVFSIAQFCSALCFSIQAPFFPQEAEKKEAVASQYGFVFGIYELVIFIFSPIYGRFLNALGVKLVNNTGIFTMSITCMLFGLLDKMNGTSTFIAFAFLIRIMEATGAAAFVTAAFSIIAREFPDDVGSTFATLETFFGLGLILGPTVGGALYEVGGFILPFLVVGSILFIAGIMILCLLPRQDGDPITAHNSQGIIALVRKPPVFISAVTVLGASFSIGFVQATLEPHLRPLNLSPIKLGMVFVLNGATYAISAPIWGRLCDKCLSPKAVCIMGAAFIATSFVLIGPAPYLPLDTTLPIVIVALVVQGLGMGAELIATFSGMHKDAIALGFPDDISTYGMVSGLWNSSFALGAFIGPSLSGILFDRIGFSWASQTVVALHSLILVITAVYVCFFRPPQKRREELFDEDDSTSIYERQPILSRDVDISRSYDTMTSRDVY